MPLVEAFASLGSLVMLVEYGGLDEVNPSGRGDWANSVV
jgi:hypothetical protein